MTPRPEDGSAPSYRVFRPELPEVCATDPARMVFTADAQGRCEVFTWDAGTSTARQVTDRPGGTLHCSIDADAHVWWFEEDAHAVGKWRFQAFEGGPVRDGLRGVPAGRARGLAVGGSGVVALALGDDRGTTVYGGPRGGEARTVTRLPRHAHLTGISGDGELLAVGGQARSAHAVTVFRTRDGSRAAALGPQGGALWSLGFGPAAGQHDLLLVRQDAERYLLATWRPGESVRTHTWCAFDTEITARWCPDGKAVLIRQDRHGRSVLHRADLSSRTLSVLPTAPGTLLDAAEHAHGDVHTLWTSTTQPPRTASSAGTPLPSLPRLADPVPGVQHDLWTPGPDGDLHTLVTLPEGARGPVPTVFLVHGGPADHDRDAYDGTVHSLVASGFAVARVNYRGSTGYGPTWRAAMTEGVGLTQVNDLAAARAELVARRWSDPDSLALWGTSWGGYLTLLALGSRPGLWRAGVAVKPVAHLAHAHATTTPALRALDERLFGGTPEEVPERYARSSPHTFLPHLEAPLLVVAARHDAKCPPGQVMDYTADLTARGKRHEVLWLDTGHDGYDGADHVHVLRSAVVFLDRELRGRRRTTPTAPPATRRGESGRTAHHAPVPAGKAPPHLTERTTDHAEGHHSQRPARG
ncbi:alpha/beta fold hydrolase [Streptomyces sp. NPDC048442]|uniref:alpha/beta hydrolase family protein n=1 Tax=Streptomyces sp. NPDC048442 TaxID=3154823 RepID=UPI00342B87BF